MTSTVPNGSPLRKKPIILSGDIRNLDSNFELVMSHVRVTLAHVISAFGRYGIAVSNDDAKTLLYEYEENNDTNLGYDAFVDDLVQMLRQTAFNKTGTTRTQLKKIRLAHHLDKLSTHQAHIVHKLQTLLGDKLRVSWTTVRDTFRSADPARKGVLPKHEFARLCQQLQVPMSATLLDGLVVRHGVSAEGVVDYTEFLAYFGADFQHSDPNSVSNSLMVERGVISGKGLVYGIENGERVSRGVVNHTLSSPGVSSALGGGSKKSTPSSPPSPTRCRTAVDPLYMERLHITLNEKVASRRVDVKKAFLALDKDDSGRVSVADFTRVLHNFSLVVTQDEISALSAHLGSSCDGMINYYEFLATFGDVLKPSEMTIRKDLQENSSLVFTGHKDVKGANKNRAALSSPGNELKEAFSRLSDGIWRAIYVELEMSDSRKTGFVTSAELLRVLAKYLGVLPQKSFAVLFRTCGSHVNQLMSYHTLVKSYRPVVMDVVTFFQQDAHSNAEKTFDKSPTESLVMVWSVRVQRAQLTATAWHAFKERVWAADVRRQGRILATEFKAIVQPRLTLSDDQVAFLCFFYEDKNIASDQVLIRYGSFFTDYEDPGLETANMTSCSPTKRENPPRTERKGRVRQPGSSSPGPNGLVVAFTDADKMEYEQEEKRLRAFFVANLRALEALLAQEDVDKKGFVSVERFVKFCKELNGGRWKETDASAAFFSKYVAQNQLFYYRGFLLDVDQKAGLQTQALVLQDDDDDGNDLEARDRYSDPNDDNLGQILDVYQAKDALRYHLTSTRTKQKTTYKLFQRLDPGKSGLLAYPELRRVLERLGIVVDDTTVHEWLSHQFEEEDDAGNKTGRIKYLQILHAHGGRDPDKVDAMSDLSSNCSYYSAISISPRPAVRSSHGGGASSPRAIGNRDYVAAAHAVTNAIEKPRNGFTPLTGTAAAAAVERKIKAQLDASGTKNKWKQLARAFQQIDSEHPRRGSVLAGSFQKVMREFGVHLDQEEVVRLQLKYDIEQNGRIHYHEYLRHLTNTMSDLSSGGDTAGELLPSLGPHSPRAHATKAANGVSMNNSNNSVGGISDSLRQGVKAKWKAIYSSFKTLDKQSLGRVSTAHFRQLLEWYALPVNDDAFLAILRQFDHDDDGFVDYNKFIRTCCG
uniref:EF-hand domain-containing protein n=1 Tax=Globisporangium ultimum (strain ATCC 200006 / CBS 805.95 / DAOM BR144) TaxID=431595 RepID=K3WDW8_GLOUD